MYQSSLVDSQKTQAKLTDYPEEREGTGVKSRISVDY